MQSIKAKRERTQNTPEIPENWRLSRTQVLRQLSICLNFKNLKQEMLQPMSERPQLYFKRCVYNFVDDRNTNEEITYAPNEDALPEPKYLVE